MNDQSSANDLADDIAALLAELSDTQQELLDVLAEKQRHISAGDLEALTDNQQRGQQLCQRLQSCHQRRADLLQTAAGEGLPADSIGSLAESLPIENSGEIAKQVKQSSSRMRLLQHQSLANWVLAQRSLLHLSQMLEIVASGGRLQPTYGRGESVLARGALVDQEG